VSRETIDKPGPWPVRPNVLDYRRTCAEFSWSSARAALDGLPGGRGLNIAHEAVDRHAAGPLRDRVALRFLSEEGARRDLTYAGLAEATSRFAHVLRTLGAGKGDRVFSLLGRVPELYDVIKSAGHLIGPFEVESALLEHPAVAEAAAIGKPDPVAFESVKAFVSLRSGYEPSEELRLALIGFGRSRLGKAVAPKEIEFLPALPRTRSGKIMRRLLKARELGLPEGDLSTLEGGV